MRHLVLCALLSVKLPISAAQQSSVSMPQTSDSTVRTTVIVTGSPEPLTLGESPRSVVAIDLEQHRLGFETAEDYLRLDSSTFILQRGAGGAQADI